MGLWGQWLLSTHQGMALSMPACRKGERKGLIWAGLALPPVAMETAASSMAQLYALHSVK